MLDTLLNAVLPIFGAVAVGFVLARRGVVDTGHAHAINRFVFLVAIPLLLFSLIGGSDVLRFHWAVLGAYLGTEIIVYLTGFAIARRFFSLGPRESLLIGMCVGLANHVLFILPIAQLVHGPAAAVPVAAIITMDSVLIYGMSLLALDILSGRDAGHSPLRTLQTIATNPQIVAILIGLACSLIGLHPQGGLSVFTAFMGDAAAPAALFTLGILLSRPAGDGRTGQISDWALPAVATMLRLIAMPLLASAALFGILDSDPAWADPTLLVAAAPCGAMPMVIGLQYGVRTDPIVRTIFLSTLLSVITVSLVATLQLA